MPKYEIYADVMTTVYQVVEAANEDEALDMVSRYDGNWELDPDACPQPDGASDYTIFEVEE